MALDEDDARFNIEMKEEEDDDEPQAKPRFGIQGIIPGEGPRLVDEVVGGSSTRDLIQCDMVQICHGTTIPNGSPASLIVLRFSFQPVGSKKKRFKWVEVTMTFRGEAGSDDPDIIAIAPEFEERYYRSETTTEIGHELDLGLEVGIPVVKATPGYKWHMTNTAKDNDYCRVMGRSLVGENRRFRSIAFWSMHENIGSKSGVPTIMQTAVLLERGTSASSPLGQKFSATLEIKGEVNRLTEAKEKLKNLGKAISGNRYKGTDKIFNPKLSQKGKIKDQFNLGAEELVNFQKLLTGDEVPTDSEKPAETEKTPGPKEQVSQQAPQQAPQQLPQPIPQQPPKVSHEQPQTTSTLGSSSQPVIHAESGSSSLNPASQPPGHTVMSETTSPILEQPVKREDSTTTKTSSSSNGARVAELRDRLATIRIESNLVRRLLHLEKEERDVLEEITQLELAL